MIGVFVSSTCIYLSIEVPSSLNKEINNNELQIHHVLGTGFFGEVSLGIYRGDLCAVKKLKNDGDISEFEQEIHLCKSIPSHGNVVLFLGACYKPPMIVT